MASEGSGVLIDTGLSGKEIGLRLESINRDPRSIEAVVVTHEHRDHVAGVGVWARRYKVPVYIAEHAVGGVRATLGARGLEKVEIATFRPGVAFTVAGMEFTPFSTCHDAAQSVGFRVADGSATLGFATDLGQVTNPVRQMLKGVDLLFLESNHDERMLTEGPYPWFLKQRIGSSHGHLSNDDCSELIDELLHPGLKWLVLGHLSEINNRPKVAYQAAMRPLVAAGAAEEVTLLVARQDRPGTLIRT